MYKVYSLLYLYIRSLLETQKQIAAEEPAYQTSAHFKHYQTKYEHSGRRYWGAHALPLPHQT